MDRMLPLAARSSGALAICLFACPAAAQNTEGNGYEFACETASGNLQSEENVCVAFEFNDGTNEISAGMATTNQFAEFDGSLWRLTDGVRLAFGTTEITADNALLRFERNELVRGELNGSPVVMSDYIAERQQSISGTSESLSYDRDSGMVHLTGRATLAIGDDEVQACDWIYNVMVKTYEVGASGNCNGVQIRLTPPEEGDTREGQPQAP